jgi:hypothetical protein
MKALWNKIQQLEKKEAATQRQVEVMQRRFDRQEANRKIELHKQEAEARCDKLQALLEKGEAKTKIKMDKRDAQARCDKLEAKAEMDKRDARYDTLKMKTEMDKRDAQHELKAEMDKRDAQARCDVLEMKAEIMKDMLLQQRQISQLKWDARPGQAPQVLYSSPPPPVVAPPSYIPQQTHQPSVNPAVLLASVNPVKPPKNMQGVVSDVPASPSPADAAVVGGGAAVAAVVVKSVTMPSQQHQKPSLPIPEQRPVHQQPSCPPSHSTSTPAPVRFVLQQGHHSNNKVPAGVGVGAVPLPGDAQSHFFLSHAQSTGGDQTNAIYLELQQLGFTCWYVICRYWDLI